MINFNANNVIKQAFLMRREAELVVMETLRQTGQSNGELSYAKACRVYGDWFRSSVQEGKISPCRIGKGKSATRWFAVADILALKAVENN